MVFYMRIKHILSDVFSSSIFFLIFFLFLAHSVQKKEMLGSDDCSVQGKKNRKIHVTNQFYFTQNKTDEK